jgi:predicted RNA methylase
MSKAPRLSHIWDRHPDDWYVEPRWVSKRLFEIHKFAGAIVDPACGMGNIIASAREMGFQTLAMDIVQRSTLFEPRICDFMLDEDMLFDNIVCNPPFKHCDDKADFLFVKRCLDRATDQVALMLPCTWVLGDDRSRWLEETPLSRIYYITPRPSMPPGPVIEAGVKPGGGKQDFAWYVWKQGHRGPASVGWCRRDG